MKEFGLAFVAAGMTFVASAETIDVSGYSLAIAEGTGVKSLETLTSPVIEVAGSASEITAKAQACVARSLANSAVSTSGGGGTFADGLVGMGRTQNGQLDGGQVIETVDVPNGLIVANSRVEYRRAMLGYVAQTRFTFEAKEGRFRIVQTDLRNVQKSTGSMPNSGFGIIVKAWGTGWEAAVEAMRKGSDSVITCMTKPAGDDTW